MNSVPDSVGIIVMSYFANGIAMVTYHSKRDLIDQPAYVRESVSQRIVAACFWPSTAKENDDLPFVLTCFLGTIAIFWLYFVILRSWISSTMFRFLLIGIVFAIPRLGNVFLNGPSGITSAILWVLIVKPLGGRRPLRRYRGTDN